MTKQEQHNEWHNELKVLCKALIMSHNSYQTAKKKGVKMADSGEEFMNMFRQHFAKVSIKQNSEMDAILEYEDMLDYAKWYVSGGGVI